jgi:hypothetical protein
LKVAELGVAGEGVVSVEPSARQDAMNSCRRGFIRCRIREGPIGSHQELASPEKWESSSAETEDVECLRVGVGVWVAGWIFGRAERVDFSGEGLVNGWIERRARRGVVLGRREAILGVDVLVVRVMEN